MDCFEMAKTMLGIDQDNDLPEGLKDRLSRVQQLIHAVKPHGDFGSSQGVAMMVEQWQRGQP